MAASSHTTRSKSRSFVHRGTSCCPLSSPSTPVYKTTPTGSLRESWNQKTRYCRPDGKSATATMRRRPLLHPKTANPPLRNDDGNDIVKRKTRKRSVVVDVKKMILMVNEKRNDTRSGVDGILLLRRRKKTMTVPGGVPVAATIIDAKRNAKSIRRKGKRRVDLKSPTTITTAMTVMTAVRLGLESTVSSRPLTTTVCKGAFPCGWPKSRAFLVFPPAPNNKNTLPTFVKTMYVVFLFCNLWGYTLVFPHCTEMFSFSWSFTEYCHVAS